MNKMIFVEFDKNNIYIKTRLIIKKWFEIYFELTSISERDNKSLIISLFPFSIAKCIDDL